MPFPHPAHLKFHFHIGFSLHDGYLVPECVPAPKLPHIDFDFLQGVMLGEKPSFDFLGTLAGKPNIDPTLGPLLIPFEGRGNDSGFLIPHISIPPNNVMLIPTILFAGSIAVLGASRVQVATYNPLAHLGALPPPLGWLGFLGDSGETDMATTLFPLWPISLNLGCWDPIPLPTDFVYSPNNVLAGITLGDYLAAGFTIALEMALAAVSDKIGDAVGKIPGKLKGAWGSGAAKMGAEGVEAGAEGASSAAARSASDALPEPPAHVLQAGEVARRRRIGPEPPEGVLRAGEVARERRLGPDLPEPPAHVLRAGEVARARRVPSMGSKLLESFTSGFLGSFGSTIDDVAGMPFNLAIWAVKKAVKKKQGQGGEEIPDDALSDYIADATNFLTTPVPWLWNKGDLAEALGLLEPGHPRPTLRAPDLAGEDEDGNLRANAPFRVVVEFDRPVREFAQSDLHVTNATVGGFTPGDGGEHESFEFTLTPASNGEVSASIPAASCFQEIPYDLSDLLSLGRIEGQRFYNLPGRIHVLYSSDRPTVALEVEHGNAGTTSDPQLQLTARFSEDVHLEVGNIEARKVDTGEMAEILDFGAVDGSEREYAFSVDVDGYDGELSVRIPENGARTPFGNGNHASADFRTRVDRQGPMVVVTGPGAPTGMSPLLFRVRFDEPVDFASSHAVATCDGAPAPIRRFERTAETVYEVDVEPTGPGVVELSIPAGRVEDLAGNANESGASDSVDYDPLHATDPASPDLAHFPEADREAIRIGAEIMGLRGAGSTT